jgi:hypothetical protein
MAIAKSKIKHLKNMWSRIIFMSTKLGSRHESRTKILSVHKEKGRRKLRYKIEEV